MVSYNHCPFRKLSDWSQTVSLQVTCDTGHIANSLKEAQKRTHQYVERPYGVAELVAGYDVSKQIDKSPSLFILLCCRRLDPLF